MKRIVIQVLGLAGVISAIMLTACGQNKPSFDKGVISETMTGELDVIQETIVSEKEFSKEDAVMSAMYIPIADDIHLFIGEDTGSVFYIQFPDEIYDLDNHKITKMDLKKGNVVKLYGDGIMLNSYPGQYPGIHKIVVIETGNPSDADVYQEIIDAFYQEPDPSAIPSLNLNYEATQAIVTSTVNDIGHEWSYEDASGVEQSISEDVIPVLQLGDSLSNIRLSEPTDLQLSFTEEPVDVVVYKWNADLMNANAISTGEIVKTDIVDGTIVIPDADVNTVYEITGTWLNGSVTYGFITVTS